MGGKKLCKKSKNIGAFELDTERHELFKGIQTPTNQKQWWFLRATYRTDYCPVKPEVRTGAKTSEVLQSTCKQVLLRNNNDRRE